MGGPARPNKSPHLAPLGPDEDATSGVTIQDPDDPSVTLMHPPSPGTPGYRLRRGPRNCHDRNSLRHSYAGSRHSEHHPTTGQCYTHNRVHVRPVHGPAHGSCRKGRPYGLPRPTVGHNINSIVVPVWEGLQLVRCAPKSIAGGGVESVIQRAVRDGQAHDGTVEVV